jgi:hypothetical protein
MRIGRGSRSTRRKPVPVPLCAPHIPHDMTWARSRAALVTDVTPHASKRYVEFDDLTAVVMKSSVFWDITP